MNKAWRLGAPPAVPGPMLFHEPTPRYPKFHPRQACAIEPDPLCYFCASSSL
ncbi:hypothetical protein CCM_06163 [Cordyceps militaris CM01]|uniref:Uncharacterized protein n=1 Tax=Cordyceps militaris (strain CM01) TaxID=983644 RepID=G3JJ61_CORMM|nr:uncharacterized protein CCM_06163 [Cordyceps militaris CM01]EGX92003.1 hypothetical protein CCM_06163 [Cordyceps militaris CM01]